MIEELFPVHLRHGLFRLFPLSILYQCVSLTHQQQSLSSSAIFLLSFVLRDASIRPVNRTDLDITRTSIQVEVDVHDLAVIGKEVLYVFLRGFFVHVGHDDDPSFDRCDTVRPNGSDQFLRKGISEPVEREGGRTSSGDVAGTRFSRSSGWYGFVARLACGIDAVTGIDVESSRFVIPERMDGAGVHRGRQRGRSSCLDYASSQMELTKASSLLPHIYDGSNRNGNPSCSLGQSRLFRYSRQARARADLRRFLAFRRRPF